MCETAPQHADTASQDLVTADLLEKNGGSQSGNGGIVYRNGCTASQNSGAVTKNGGSASRNGELVVRRVVSGVRKRLRIGILQTQESMASSPVVYCLSRNDAVEKEVHRLAC